MTTEQTPQSADPPRPVYRKARPRGLNRFQGLRAALVRLRWVWFARIWGMDIDPSVQMSLSAKFDLTYPQGVHVGANSYIAFETRILTHDRTRGLYLHTRIGQNCFIGGRSLLLPGVEIGDNCVWGRARSSPGRSRPGRWWRAIRPASCGQASRSAPMAAF